MEAIILCGGFATRLEPISLYIPKPLLPVGGRPIIDYIMDSLTDIGINRIVVSTNKKFGDQFDYWIENKKEKLGLPIDLVVEPTLTNAEKFGAIKGISYVIKSMGIDDDVVIVAGDNYYSFDLKQMYEEFKKLKSPIVALQDIGSIEQAKRFGVAVTYNGKIVEFEEKPAEPKTTTVSTGIYMLPRDSLGKVDEYLRGSNNPDAPGHFLKWLVRSSTVYGFKCEGEWADIGTLETYKRVFESARDAHGQHVTKSRSGHSQ